MNFVFNCFSHHLHAILLVIAPSIKFVWYDAFEQFLLMHHLRANRCDAALLGELAPYDGTVLINLSPPSKFARCDLFRRFHLIYRLCAI
jgi:hypothetical protein